MNLKTITGVGVLSLLLTMGTAFGQTIMVNTSDDVIDFGGAQQVGDLPGPDGKISLPEAGLASDNTPGVQTIGFQIPQNEWQFQNFFPGRAVLRPFLGFRVFDTAIIDGTTQTAFSGDTNPDGGEVVIWQETYLIDNVGGAMFGFDHSSIHLSGGSGNVIQGNTATGIELFDSHANLIGGTQPGEGNTGGFIQIDRSSDNVVIGNTVNRVRVLGWIGNGQPAMNNRIGGPSLGERNHILGLGTLNEHGFPSGFGIQLFNAIGTVIENNWIGMSADGLSQGHPYTTAGIYFDTENYETTIRDNRIAGILALVVPPHSPSYFVGTGIELNGAGGGVSIVGNKIGLDANDQPVLGSITGISSVHYFYPDGIHNVVVGGPAPGDGNEIAGHLDAGISVANTYSGMRISGNSIHDNGGLGIDLVSTDFQYGVTPNDPLDPDTGGNGLQNFPEILTATDSGQAISVMGQFNSEPLNEYTLEFFASSAGDPSGFGEGQLFLGSTSVTTDADGNAAFDVALPTTLPAGWLIASTATSEASGSTSEFSAYIPIQTNSFAPDSFTITRGFLVSGSIVDLTTSDDSDITARRNAADISSQVFMEVTGISSVPAPMSLEFTLEASVFARSSVVQAIDLYNYDSDSWEEVDSRAATRFFDSTTIVAATGDLSRFVQIGTNTLRARCRYESPNARQQFSVGVDRVAWTIAN